MRKLASIVIAATLPLIGCGGTDQPEQDPYEVYLEIAPEDATELSREDAQTRAVLGCDQEFAPGTVDAALAEAYDDLC